MDDVYAVIKFVKKIDITKPEGICFVPKEVVVGTICDDEDDREVFLGLKTSDVLPFIECFNLEKYKNEDYLFGFPFKVASDMKEYLEKEASGDLQLLLKKYFEEVAKCEYFPSNQTKDNELLSFITAIDRKGKYVMPYFEKSFFDFSNINPKQLKETNKKKTRLDILKELKEIIIAQDSQVTTLVNTVFSNQKYNKFDGAKENILIIGSTGTGKTAMVDNLAKLIDIPIIRRDATKYSTTGYVGGSVTDMIKSLYIEAGYDKEKTENGIIAIDEIDKLGRNSGNTTVRTTDVQQELLGIIEGGEYTFDINNRDVTIDTSKITFILSGAFQEIIERKKKDSKKLGFEVEHEEEHETIEITREDLSKYGGIEPEFLRRIPVIIQTNSLDRESLKDVLTKSKISNLKIWQNAFKLQDNVELNFLDETLDVIVDKAYETNAGASGLKSIISHVLSEIKPNIIDGKIRNCKVVITKETVEDPSKYLVKKRNEKNELSKKVRGSY